MQECEEGVGLYDLGGLNNASGISTSAAPGRSKRFYSRMDPRFEPSEPSEGFEPAERKKPTNRILAMLFSILMILLRGLFNIVMFAINIIMSILDFFFLEEATQRALRQHRRDLEAQYGIDPRSRVDMVRNLKVKNADWKVPGKAVRPYGGVDHVERRVAQLKGYFGQRMERREERERDLMAWRRGKLNGGFEGVNKGLGAANGLWVDEDGDIILGGRREGEDTDGDFVVRVG